MDFQDHRYARAFDVVGRQQDPARDILPVGHGHGDLARLAKLLAREEHLVQPGELHRTVAAQHRDIGRPRRTSRSEGEIAAIRHRPLSADIGAGVARTGDARGQRIDRTGGGHSRHTVDAFVLVPCENAGLGPFEAVETAVETGGNPAMVGPVGIHQVEARHMRVAAFVVEA